MGSGKPTTGSGAAARPGQDQIRAYLDALTASPAFAASSRRSQLLRYIAAKSLAGEGERLNEYAIGIDVFEKPESFDPRIDSIVRTEISRLRQRLKDYYTGEGMGDPLRIELPVRSYVPVFAFRQVDTTSPALPEIELPFGPAPGNAVRRRHLRFWVALSTVTLLAGLLVWRATNPPATPETTIAILPFLNLTGDPALDYLCDSLSDEVTESLAEVRNLRVVARTSAFQFKGKNRDVREIGRALNAGALLEGSVQQQNGRYRVVAQLIRVADGYHVWSHTYDSPPSELAVLETNLARDTTRALLPNSGTAARAAALVKPEAHDLYMRAIYQLQLRTPDSVRLSLALSKQAVNADPSYALAYIAISRAEGTLAQLTMTSGREAFERQEAAARKALALDPELSDGHAYLGFIAYVKDWDWPRAEKEFRLALQGSGSRGQVHNLYGWSLITRGRFTEARNHLQLAEDLDPLSPGSRANMIVALIFEHRLADAKREIDGIFKLNPKSLTGAGMLGWADILDKDCSGALDAHRKIAEWYPSLAVGPGTAIALATCGEAEHAKPQLAAFERKHPKGSYSPYQLAEAYATLRSTDRAIHYLEQAAEERETQVLYMRIDSLLDPLHGDPRFVALEHRLGLLP